MRQGVPLVGRPGSAARVTSVEPITTTHEGGPAWLRDARSELFILGVSNLVGEKTFYESADDRDARYRDLVHQVAVADPQWTASFLRWLRYGANLRSAALVGALEAAHAMIAAKIPGSRQIVASVLLRADEPGEALAYWFGRYGRAIPKPVKRGIADAVSNRWTEYGLLKYDTDSKGIRFADVLDLVHPSPRAPWQGDLFRYALDRRHGHSADPSQALAMVSGQVALRRRVASGDTSPLFDPRQLAAAGMTWEDALSLAGSRVDKAALWAALIPSMGMTALLRNLRNFDQAGVSNVAVAHVIERFTDADQVSRSRVLPFQWYTAYFQAPLLRWGHALDRALGYSLAAVKSLGLRGRSLVLIDMSASMTSTLGARGTVRPVDAAAVFGVSLARAVGADLYGFANRAFRHDVRPGASVIEEIKRFTARIGEVGHGTFIRESIRTTYAGHDRVIVITDEQSADRVSGILPGRVPLYGFNLGGYRAAMAPWGSSGCVQLGGLTDATFRMIPLIEAGRASSWPWEDEG